MNYLSLDQLASVSELQRNYLSLIEKVKKIAKPLFLLRRNEPEAVLISISEYQDMAEKKRLYEESEALRAIESFEKDKKGKRLFSGKTASDLLKFEGKL